MTMDRHIFRTLLSSPAYIQREREAVKHVVDQLGGIYAEPVDLRLNRLEWKFCQATRSFQAQIASTMECDLVITTFWKWMKREPRARMHGGSKQALTKKLDTTSPR